MKTYKFPKLLGILIGTLTLFLTLGFVYFAIVGMGFSQTFTPGIDQLLFIIILAIIPLLLGGITAIGPFGLKRKGWRFFYIIFTIVIGICFLGVYLLTLGALGSLFEAFLLAMGILYCLQAFLVMTKK